MKVAARGSRVAQMQNSIRCSCCPPALCSVAFASYNHRPIPYTCIPTKITFLKRYKFFETTMSMEPITPQAHTKRPRVALIGCGAAGMCFLHALATRFQKDPDDERLPSVVCFERAEEPGGCWRSPPKEERDQIHNITCWYDDVWLNIPKESFEFADYTFEQHFNGKRMPVFLPKKEAMEYFICRTRTVDANLYKVYDSGETNGARLHEIRFCTVVTSVTYNAETEKFLVESAPFDPMANIGSNGQATKTEIFDYCVWAAGTRGKPRIPRSLLDVLRTGGDIPDGDDDADSKPTPFAGTILHSTHQASPAFDDAIIGKRVVLIGDSNSAEDLALHAIKIGVDKVYVLSRSGYRDCVYMGSWPSEREEATGILQSKVEVHVALPYRILADGRSMRCDRTVWNDKDEVYELSADVAPITIQDIDSVIFCTGYVPNSDFLHEDLRAQSDLYTWFWSAPPDFKMKQNPFTEELGEIKPSAELCFSGNIVPGLYRTMLISNPKMMYILDMSSEYPLLRQEALAWLCLAYITGDAPTPSSEEMEQKIQEQMMDEMNISYLRWSMDRNYFEAMNVIGDNHWSDNPEDPRSMQLNRDFYKYFTSVIAREFKDSKYPVDFGTYEELNDHGNMLVDLGLQNLYVRHLLKDDSPDAEWRTFRDVDPAPFRSIYTGQQACAFRKHWLDIVKNEALAE